MGDVVLFAEIARYWAFDPAEPDLRLAFVHDDVVANEAYLAFGRTPAVQIFPR